MVGLPEEEEVALMRRLVLLVTVAVVMAVIMAASALPVFAAAKFPEANCTGRVASSGDNELISQTAIHLTPGISGIGAIASTNCSTR